MKKQVIMLGMNLLLIAQAIIFEAWFAGCYPVDFRKKTLERKL